MIWINIFNDILMVSIEIIVQLRMKCVYGQFNDRSNSQLANQFPIWLAMFNDKLIDFDQHAN